MFTHRNLLGLASALSLGLHVAALEHMREFSPDTRIGEDPTYRWLSKNPVPKKHGTFKQKARVEAKRRRRHASR